MEQKYLNINSYIVYFHNTQNYKFTFWRSLKKLFDIQNCVNRDLCSLDEASLRLLKKLFHLLQQVKTGLTSTTIRAFQKMCERSLFLILYIFSSCVCRLETGQQGEREAVLQSHQMPNRGRWGWRFIHIHKPIQSPVCFKPYLTLTPSITNRCLYICFVSRCIASWFNLDQ